MEKVITEILFAELQIKFGYKKYFLDFELGNQSFMHQEHRNRANHRTLRYSYKFYNFHDKRYLYLYKIRFLVGTCIMIKVFVNS